MFNTLESKKLLEPLESNRKTIVLADAQPSLFAEATAFVSQPVFKGIDFEITVTDAGDEFDDRNLPDPARDLIRQECSDAAHKLKGLFLQLRQTTRCSKIVLECTFVPDYMHPIGILSVYRILALDGDFPFRQFPYQLDIFESDYGQPPRFLTWLSHEEFADGSALMQEATDQLLNDGFEEQPLFDELIWIPISEDSSLPALMTERCDPSRKDIDLFEFLASIKKHDPAKMVHIDSIQIPELEE